MFLVNGKPFLILFHISCGFLNMLGVFFKQLKLRVYKLCVKQLTKCIYYHHIEIAY